MSRPRLQKSILEALEREGITERRFAQKIREGIDANTRWGNPDHTARVKYLHLIGDIKGYKRPQEVNVNLGLNKFNVIQDVQKVNKAIEIIEAEIVERGEDAQLSHENGAQAAG